MRVYVQVFISAWTDENPIDSFLKLCYVLPPDLYQSLTAEVCSHACGCAFMCVRVCRNGQGGWRGRESGRRREGGRKGRREKKGG